MTALALEFDIYNVTFAIAEEMGQKQNIMKAITEGTADTKYAGPKITIFKHIYILKIPLIFRLLCVQNTHQKLLILLPLASAQMLQQLPVATTQPLPSSGGWVEEPDIASDFIG